jgi:hypothetical protein
VILLVFRVGLEQLLSVKSPLDERRAELGIHQGQAGEGGCLPRLDPQVLGRGQDDGLVCGRQQEVSQNEESASMQH